MDEITLQILTLKKLVDEGLLRLTWDEIAERVGLANGEQARNKWRAAKDNPENEPYHEKGNNIILNHISEDRVTSPDKLLELNNVDMEIWRIEKQSLRKWESFSKKQLVDLKYHTETNSKGDPKTMKDGYVLDEGTVNLVELFYIRVELVRRKPEPVIPFIRPVEINLPEMVNDGTFPDLVSDEETFTLVIGDPQMGFWKDPDSHQPKLVPLHDEEMLSSVLRYAIEHSHRIDKIIWTGDVLDLSEFSDRWLTELEHQRTTQLSLYAASFWFGRFKEAVPHAEQVYLEGNHEIRFRKLILSKLPQILGLSRGTDINGTKIASLEYFLGLDSLGVTFVGEYPDGVYIHNDVVYIHGKLAGKSGETVSRMLKKYPRHSTVQGHIHRKEIAYMTIHDLRGTTETIFAMSPGCTCRLDGAVPGVAKRQNWQHSVGKVYSKERAEFLYVENQTIVESGYSYPPLPDVIEDFYKMIDEIKLKEPELV